MAQFDPHVFTMEFNRNDIKPEITRSCGAIVDQPMTSSLTHSSKFLLGYPGFCWREAAGASGFDFHKKDEIFPSDNEVQFSALTAISLLQAGKSAKFEVTESLGFTPEAQLVIS